MFYIKVFSGSEIIAYAIQNELRLIGIVSRLKNHIESAVMAGFGTADLAVDVFVNQRNVIQARLVVEKFMA